MPHDARIAGLESLPGAVGRPRKPETQKHRQSPVELRSSGKLRADFRGGNRNNSLHGNHFFPRKGDRLVDPLQAHRSERQQEDAGHRCLSFPASIPGRVHHRADDERNGKKQRRSHDNADKALTQKNAGDEKRDAGRFAYRALRALRACREHHEDGQQSRDTDKEGGGLFETVVHDPPVRQTGEADGQDDTGQAQSGS